MDDPVANAKANLAKLESVVADAQEQIAEAKEFLRLYDKYGSKPPMIGAFTVTKPKIAFNLKDHESKGATILAAAKAILSDGQPRPTRILLQEVKSLGVRIGGDDEASMLSVYLSKAKGIFKSDRKHGWSLKKD